MPDSMMRAYLQLWGGRIQLLCPYVVNAFVERLYAMVPAHQRVQFGKGWLIDLSYYNQILPVIRKYFPKPVISGALIFYNSRLSPEEIERRRREHYRKLADAKKPPERKTRKPPLDFDQMRRAFGLPEKPTLEALKERYRALSLRYHPDKGGDKMQMQIINRIYEKLREKLELKE
jgi:hypothetical protein